MQTKTHSVVDERVQERHPLSEGGLYTTLHYSRSNSNHNPSAGETCVHMGGYGGARAGKKGAGFFPSGQTQVTVQYRPSGWDGTRPTGLTTVQASDVWIARSNISITCLSDRVECCAWLALFSVGSSASLVVPRACQKTHPRRWFYTAAVRTWYQLGCGPVRNVVVLVALLFGWFFRFTCAF